MAENQELTIEVIESVVTPLERKYAWRAEGVAEGVFELSITDDQHTAKGLVTSIEEIDELVKKLESEVDEHNYKVIG